MKLMWHSPFFIISKAMKNRAANFSCCPSPKHSRANLNPLLKNQKNKTKPQSSRKPQKGNSSFIVSLAIEKSWVFCFFCMPRRCCLVYLNNPRLHYQPLRDMDVAKAHTEAGCRLCAVWRPKPTNHTRII